MYEEVKCTVRGEKDGERGKKRENPLLTSKRYAKDITIMETRMRIESLNL